MAKYLLTYQGGTMPETEEEGAKVMAAWAGWMGQLGTALVDPGNPISKSATIDADGSTTAGINTATGYSVITADSIEAALVLAKSCPILASGGSVEVGETFDAM